MLRSYDHLEKRAPEQRSADLVEALPRQIRQAMAAAHAQELPFDFEFQGAFGSEYA